MPQFLKNIRIKTATEGTHKHLMRAQHDTTIDFGQFNILKAKYMTAGYGEIKPWTYINMETLPQPTWGEVKYESRIYAVPVRTIFKGFHDYKEDVVHITADESTSSANMLPWFDLQEAVQAIQTWLIDLGTTEPASYMLAIRTATGTPDTFNYYNHSIYSLPMIKMLEQLGYRLVWDVTRPAGKPVSALRLLAVAKIYIDYYYNNAYIGDKDYVDIKKIFERDNGNLKISRTELDVILRICTRVFYDSDYLTSAWDRPNTPNLAAEQQSVYNIPDPNNPIAIYTAGNLKNTEITNSDATSSTKDPFINLTGSNAAPVITQTGLNLLRSLTMFLKRNQLAGGAAMERLLARYGTTPLALKLEKAKEIAKIEWGMNVTPVFSNADTAASGGEALGNYAGYGYAISGKKGEASYGFQLEEPSILIETLTVTPIETYVQGIDGENLALGRLELPTPEFDNVGVDVILKSQVYMADLPTMVGGVDHTELFAGLFAFEPRYAKFKTMRDQATGNFSIPNMRSTYLPWTMTRWISPNSMSEVVHSKDFTKMESNAKQIYGRIFTAGTTNILDNFRVHHEVELEWHSWMKPLYNYYDWEHEGGKEITIQNNGPTAN